MSSRPLMPAKRLGWTPSIAVPTQQTMRPIAPTKSNLIRWTLDRNEKLTAFVAILLGAFVFSSACPARGAEPENPGEPPITYLEEGDAAPFAGDLFPPAKSTRLGIRLEGCQQKAALDLSHTTQIFENELQRERDKGAARLKAEHDRKLVWKAEAERAGAWYRSPEFIAPIAIAGTILVFVVSIYAYDAIADSMK